MRLFASPPNPSPPLILTLGPRLVVPRRLERLRQLGLNRVVRRAHRRRVDAALGKEALDVLLVGVLVRADAAVFWWGWGGCVVFGCGSGGGWRGVFGCSVGRGERLLGKENLSRRNDGKTPPHFRRERVKSRPLKAIDLLPPPPVPPLYTHRYIKGCVNMGSSISLCPCLR